MDEVKQDIASYTSEKTTALDVLYGENAELVDEVALLSKTLEEKQATFETNYASAKSAYESTLRDASAEHAKTARRAEEFKSEVSILSNRAEMLEAEIFNSKQLVEKKNSFIESLQKSTDQESEELREHLKDLKAQLKSKSAEL
mmetsp:Transcript_32895/g.27844  ORF Transcript_32895/g.27844 Transcript_32895/m.27844 type:complete len:144 (+) Transcript_32895:3023-3454(+)